MSLGVSLRHYVQYITLSEIIDEFYYRRSLNDLPVIGELPQQDVNTASTSTNVDEVYYRRYLNDL